MFMLPNRVPVDRGGSVVSLLERARVSTPE